MEEKGIARTFGPAGVAGCFAVTFPQLPLPVGLAGMAAFAAVTIWGYSDALMSRVPWLRRFQAAPMSFGELARRVAFESIWAAGLDLSKERRWENQQDWRLPLKAEICRPLISGEIVAHGILTNKEVAMENNASLIPAAFWRTASFYADLLLMEARPHEAPDFANGELNGEPVMFSEITFDRRAVERVWPVRSARKRRKQPSPFVALSDQQQRQMHEQLNRHQQEWWDENGPKIFGPARSIRPPLERNGPA